MSPGSPNLRRTTGLVVKGSLVGLGAIFAITLRAFPEAYAQNAKPFTEFVSITVVGVITLGALLLLLVTMATAIGTRDLGLALLVAALGATIFALLHAVVLVQPAQSCKETLIGALTGAPECIVDYSPQMVAAFVQFLSIFPLAIVGLSPLAFLRRKAPPPPEPLVQVQVQVPAPAAAAPPTGGTPLPPLRPPSPPSPRPAARLVSPPPKPIVAPRAPPPRAAPPPELHPMNSYLVLGSNPQMAYAMLNKLGSKGSPTLCISRTHPDEVRRAHGLPESSRVYWLSKTEERESLNPANMEQIFQVVQEFLTSQKNAALLFDGVEYLAAERDFSRVLKFIYNLQEAVAVNKAILLVPVNPAALGEKEVGLLSRDMKIVKSSAV